MAANLKKQIQDVLNNRIHSDDFNILEELEALLLNFGLTSSDSGGLVSFIGKDPIVPSTVRFASATGLGLAAKAVAVAHLWKYRTGEGQHIKVDLRKVI